MVFYLPQDPLLFNCTILFQSHLKLTSLILTEYNLMRLQWVNGGYFLKIGRHIGL